MLVEEYRGFKIMISDNKRIYVYEFQALHINSVRVAKKLIDNYIKRTTKDHYK